MCCNLVLVVVVLKEEKEKDVWVGAGKLILSMEFHAVVTGSSSYLG